MRVPALLVAALLAGCAPERVHVDVDSTVVPYVPTVAGVNEGDPPRAVGTLMAEDGTRADFVLDELLIVAPSVDAVQPLLDRYGGTIVGEHPLPAEDAVSLLVRVAPSAPEPGQIGRDLSSVRPDLRGDFQVDSEAGLALIAAAAAEADTFQVSLNWIPELAAIPDGTTEEAPVGPSGYDADAFTWSYMSAGSNQDVDVGGAWQMLEQAGRLGHDVRIMVADGGFVPNADFPSARSIVGAEWGDPGAWTCGGNPCPFHGTNVSLVAMAAVDNDFGVAGPAGVLDAELIAVAMSGGIWESAQRISDAADDFDPDIINMSFGFNPPISFVPFGPGYQPSIDPQVAHFVELAQRGISLFAAAGNSGFDVNSDDGVDDADPRAQVPCQLTMVSCVGGMGNDTTARHGSSNYGSGGVSDSVEIYGPYLTFVPNDPSDPSEDTMRWGGGTSYSSPFVAGIAALVMAADPSLSAAEVRALLRDTAHVGGLGSEVTSPQLRIDAGAAVAAALGIPTVEITEPRSGYSVPLGTEIVFEAETSEDVSLTWTLAGAERSTNPSGANHGHTLFYDGLPPGEHLVVATAEVAGIEVSDSIVVDIEYDATDVFILTPLPNKVRFAEEDLQLVGHTSAGCCLLPDTGVTWRIYDDGGSQVFSATGHTATVPADTLLPGTYDVEIEGNDGVAAVTRDIELVVVSKPNDYPTAVITLPNSGDSWVGARTVEFQGYGVDPEDGVLGSQRLKWTAEWSGGTIDLCTGWAWTGGSGTCGFFEYELRDLAGGGTTYTIRLEAKDEDGNVDDAEIGVTIEFAPVP